MMDLLTQVEQLYQQQLKAWPLLARNVASLQKIKTKNLEIQGECLMVQYNPERVRSATAFVDRSAVVARPCFLCQNNLPVEQLGISVLNRYRLLCNPYPIAPYHFTIAERQHCPQQIAGRIDHLLALSELCPVMPYFTMELIAVLPRPIISIFRHCRLRFFRCVGGIGKNVCHLVNGK